LFRLEVLFGILFYLFTLYCLFSLSLDAANFEDLQGLQDQDFEQQIVGNPGK
jgi:hypothetical protein